MVDHTHSFWTPPSVQHSPVMELALELSVLRHCTPESLWVGQRRVDVEGLGGRSGRLREGGRCEEREEQEEDCLHVDGRLRNLLLGG